MAPVVLYLLLIQAYPFVTAIMTSLTDKRIGAEGQFVGLQNYVDLFQDSLFRRAVRNTLVFTAGATVAKFIFGMIMALVLNQNIRFKNLWRALLFLPWTIPTIVTVLTFRWMYSSTGGVFNTMLLTLGPGIAAYRLAGRAGQCHVVGNYCQRLARHALFWNQLAWRLAECLTGPL